MLQTLGSLVAVAALWGGTNPFIRRGTRGLRSVQAGSRTAQVAAEIRHLLANWQYAFSWLLNQLGSLLYLLTLRSSALTLAVPVANSLAFVFTAAVGCCIGEEALTKRSLLGIVLILGGTMLCYLDKSE